MATVYVLTNPAMPGLVKIGMTSLDDHETRISQLYTTGVPVPFHIEYACEVENYTEVEKALHVAFGPSRVNPRREFFEIEPSQAVAILKLLDRGRDVTAELQADRGDIDVSDDQAAERLRKRRPQMNFSEMGIPEGSELRCSIDDSTATVFSEKKVLYNGEQMSLTQATTIAKGTDYNLAPGPYWFYQGRLLKDIYNETYTTPD